MAYSAGFSRIPRSPMPVLRPPGRPARPSTRDRGPAGREPAGTVRGSRPVAARGVGRGGIVEADGSLVEALKASRWRIQWPMPVGEAVEAFVAQSHVEVERTTKAGRRRIDVRALCSDLVMVAPDTLEVTGGACRTDSASGRGGGRDPRGDPGPARCPVLATRLAQGTPNQGAWSALLTPPSTTGHRAIAISRICHLWRFTGSICAECLKCAARSGHGGHPHAHFRGGRVLRNATRSRY